MVPVAFLSSLLPVDSLLYICLLIPQGTLIKALGFPAHHVFNKQAYGLEAHLFKGAHFPIQSQVPGWFIVKTLA